jgi:hypothetical protein
MTTPAGLARIAPTVPMRGRLFATRGRVQDADPKVDPVVDEITYYSEDSGRK